jgi:hypothetical protein
LHAARAAHASAANTVILMVILSAWWRDYFAGGQKLRSGILIR